MINSLMSLVFRTRRFIISKTRPGVPEISKQRQKGKKRAENKEQKRNEDWKTSGSTTDEQIKETARTKTEEGEEERKGREASKRENERKRKKGEKEKDGTSKKQQSLASQRGCIATTISFLSNLKRRALHFRVVVYHLDWCAADAGMAPNLHVFAKRHHHLTSEQQIRANTQTRRSNREWAATREDSGCAVEPINKEERRRQAFFPSFFNLSHVFLSRVPLSVRKQFKSFSLPLTTRVCSANSLVGDSTSACKSFDRGLIVCRIPTLKMVVFPVPLWDCAMTSRPRRIGMMARCWIADGFSKPMQSRKKTDKKFARIKKRPAYGKRKQVEKRKNGSRGQNSANAETRKQQGRKRQQAVPYA